MLVICAGMYRSGSTWQYQVACELVQRSGRAARPMGFLEGSRLADFLAGPLEPGAWYLYKTHLPDPIHRSLDPDSVCTLYSYRDLRDVAYSMAHKYGGVSFWEVARERGIVAQCIEADAFWRTMPGVTVQRYEDWTADNIPFVRRIASALGVEISEAVAAEVADLFGLQRNRDRATSLAARLTSEGVDLSDRANALRHDHASLLHWNHFRAGTVGGWREVATPEEKSYLAECCGEWLVARGYEPDQSWAGEIAGDVPDAEPLSGCRVR